MVLDLAMIRDRFPALQHGAIYLDNPAGTQVPRTTIERMVTYLQEMNANHGGAFKTSRKSDEMVAQAREAVADFLVASRPEEIVFGANMTSLTFSLSRAIGRTLRAGDEIVVTRLDHDANITPWVMVAEERGCKIRWVDFHPEDGRLDLEDFQQAMESRPRLVAVGYASNALGTINPLRKIIPLAHAAGALVFVDAVQYAPHGPIDVGELDCDFLTCSAYKFFGPHAGVLYGKYELLEQLPAYRVRPAPAGPPGKFETGTGNFEGIAGVLGALEYLEWVGTTFGDVYAERYGEKFSGRKLRLKQATAAVRAYEYELSRVLLDILAETPGVTLYGIQDVRQLEERVPTFAFTFKGLHPRQVAERLDQDGVYVWDGNYYALAVTERLGLEESGGMVRAGPVHYNTVEEIHRFGEALGRIQTEA